MTRLALLPSLLCAFACTQPTSTISSTPTQLEPQSVEPSSVEPSPAPRLPAMVRPPAPGPGEAGPAYFAADDVGVVRLDDTSFTILPSTPDKLIRDLRIGPGGNLYVLTFSALWRLEDDEFVRVLAFGIDDMESIDALAFGEQGKIYAIGSNRVGEWSDGRWTVTKKEVIDPNVGLLSGVALGYDGTLWIASFFELHHLPLGASSWTKSDMSRADNELVYNILTSPTGDIYAQVGNYLGKITPGSAGNIEKVTFTGTNARFFNELAFSPDGQLGVASLTCDLARADPADLGKAWVRDGDSNYGCEGLTAIALDGQKRMWVASRAGLHVLGPDTESVAYPSGSVRELVGNVRSIAVSGLGPKLPPAGKVRLTKLTGKILMEGTPVANAKVEICPVPASFVTAPATPCSASNARFSSTTNKQGSFTFSKVPLGNYGVAVEIYEHWRSNLTSVFGTQMKEGQAYDIGVIELREDQG